MSKKSRPKTTSLPGTLQVSSTATILEEPPIENHPLSYRLPILCLTILFLAFFGRVIFTRSDLIFRDAGSFYFPLFDFIQSQWNAGLIPLWNPYENAGVPLAANGTSSVFYPLKVIFFLPVPYDILFKSYLLLHVIFAAINMTWLSRRWGMSWMPAITAAIVFVFSAPFLFQLYNVVFLVSAAWLPLGVYFGDALIRQFNIKHLLGLAFTLAMMVLGGDPQTAYHLGIALGILSIILPSNESKQSESVPHSTGTSPSTWSSWSKRLVPRTSSLIAAASIAGLLTAIQILPTSELSRQTERSSSEIPTTIWQIPAHLASSQPPSTRFETGKPPNWYDTLIGNPPAPAKHYVQLFNYSFSPFRIGEFLFPNSSGFNFHEDSRWLNILSLEDSNIWHTSSYFGLLPASLVILSFFHKPPSRRVRWLQILVVFSLLASFGRFGPRIIADLFNGTFQSNPTATGSPTAYISMGVGGLYWFLTVALPGYNLFRYPEKWILFLCFASALLSANILDLMRNDLTSLLKSMKKLWFVIIVLAWAVFIVATPSWQKTFIPTEAQASLFSPGRAWLAIAQSLLHTTITAVLFYFSPSIASRILRRPATPQILMTTILIIISLDITIANKRWIMPVDHDLWYHRPVLADLIDASANKDEILPPRFYREVVFASKPPEGIDMPTQVITDMRAIGGVNASLDMHMCNIATRSTLDINAYISYFDSIPLPDGTFVKPRRSLDAWGTQYFVIPARENDHDAAFSSKGMRRQWLPSGPAAELVHYLPTGEPLPLATPDANQRFPRLSSLQVLKNTDAYPHSWIVRDLKLIPPIAEKDRKRWIPLMQEIIYPGGVGYDLKQTGIVETDEKELTSPSALSSTSAADDTCQLVSYSTQRVEMNAKLKSPGLVVVADTWYPGWKAYASSPGLPEVEVPIQRTNRMMRGLYLPAGDFNIRFQYEPTTFWTGAYISLVAWLAFFVVSAGIFLRVGSAVQTINPQEPAHSL